MPWDSSYYFYLKCYVRKTPEMSRLCEQINHLLIFNSLYIVFVNPIKVQFGFDFWLPFNQTKGRGTSNSMNFNIFQMSKMFNTQNELVRKRSLPVESRTKK